MLFLFTFQFPTVTVCDYHDAFYSVLVYDVTEAMIIVARTRVMTYDRDGPDRLEMVVDHGLQKDRNYVAFINVTTAVNSTIQHVPFSESIATCAMIWLSDCNILANTLYIRYMRQIVCE